MITLVVAGMVGLASIAAICDCGHAPREAVIYVDPLPEIDPFFAPYFPEEPAPVAAVLRPRDLVAPNPLPRRSWASALRSFS